ncbi:MAG: response regulator [Candidatus Methanoperedens sp.]|nr:response regulator [Candidatus Methanoperedens sp.]
MKRDPTDEKLLELIKQNGDISHQELSRILGIPEEEVIARISDFSDARSKILIVDDEMDTLLPVRRSLEVENYRVIEAYDGHEAINKAKAEIPDLILLDLMMPGMDGYEVCGKLRNEPVTQNIPIIMLTAKGYVRDKVKGLEIGADDYVTKPFDLNELKARIKSALRRTRTM